MLFAWDDTKRQANLAKHGVDFSVAEGLDWEAVINVPDMRRAYGEKRWIAYVPQSGRLYACAYTIRGETMRIISLRKANARERRFYDAKKKEA